MVAVCWPSSVTLGPCCAPNPLSSAFHRIVSDFFDTFLDVAARGTTPTRSLTGSSEGQEGQNKRTPIVEMIPDTENVCQTSEAAVRSTDLYHKIKNTPEGEAASVTAWKRYQQLVAIVESGGGRFNRKSMIEAIFRGNDLVYASH